MFDDSNFQYVGAGRILFDRFNESGARTGYRPLGNVDDFGISTEVTKLEKKSSMRGKRTLLKEVVIGSDHLITIVCSSYQRANLALALLGDVSTFTQDSESVSTGEINGGVALVFDRFFDLGKKNVTGVVINQGGPALVEGTDYELDAETGSVMILSTGDGAEVVTTWDGYAPGITSDLVLGLSVSKIEGALRFVSAEDQVAGERVEINVHKLNLTPDGDLKFIQEEFGSFTLKGKAQEDTTQPAGEEFLTLRPLDGDDMELGS